MPCNIVWEDLEQDFSIGSRVVVTDVLSPSVYISGIISSLPLPSTGHIDQDNLYEILVDFADGILDDKKSYKRIIVPSSCLTLI